jgi:Asp-tRNA(Asn)/Glu-tRNA(Gln) amidotransferase A subunit family amidase
VEDAALLADVIAGHDDRDPASEALGRPDCLAVATSRPPVTPALAFVRSPAWDRADDDLRAGFAELCAALGGTIVEVELGDEFNHGHEWHRTINLADIARHYSRYVGKDPAGVSEKLRAMIEEGLAVRAVDYVRAQEGIAVLNAGLEQVFERFDAIVTPAAAGEALAGLESTGDPAFCTLWTFCGVPAVTLPLLSGSNGLPIGVQLVGRRFYDGRLLRTARWLQSAILEPQAGAARLASGGAA